MIELDAFEKNLRCIRAQIERACLQATRLPEEVELLPVTKNHPADAVRYSAGAGLIGVGENRVQEASGKRAAFDGGRFWELIGHLQSNKVKDAVAVFDRIQSVDSQKLLQRIDRLSGEIGKIMPYSSTVQYGGGSTQTWLPLRRGHRGHGVGSTNAKYSSGRADDDCAAGFGHEFSASGFSCLAAIA